MDRATAVPSVDRLPGPRARAWVDRHHEHAVKSTHIYEFVWDPSAPAIGPFCHDVDGNLLLDFAGHVASAPLGYNHPHIVEGLEALGITEPGKIAGQDFYAGSGSVTDPDWPGPTQLLERLAELTTGHGLTATFLSNSGAEAVENAIKLCYESGGHRAVTFEGAFHGRTLGALSLNRSKTVHRRGFPAVPGVMSLPYPASKVEYEQQWVTDGPGGNVLADRLDSERGVIDPDELAFVILEPVQGEGGIRVPDPRFATDLERLRARHDLHVVVDEVQTGLGRTGKWWGIDHLELTPDAVAMAKGLRVGATMVRPELAPREPGRLSSTWGGGDLLATAAGALTIDAIREESLLENARDRGRQLQDRLGRVDGVTEVRGRGLLVGADFGERERRDRVLRAAFERGLLVLPAGHATLRLLPPLDVTEREIDLGVDLLADAVAGV